MSRHNRRRRQSPGLHGTGPRGHDGRNAKRRAQARAMTGVLKESYDVAVIGAGPAGLAAAALCARAGLATVVFDEQPGPGGQIYRAILSTPLHHGAILGDDYWRGAGLAAACAASGA